MGYSYFLLCRATWLCPGGQLLHFTLEPVELREWALYKVRGLLSVLGRGDFGTSLVLGRCLWEDERPPYC